MNALKKPRPPTSPYAVSGSESKANDRSTKGNGLASITTAVSTHTLGSSELGMKPVSATEQYWAARALTAETLLAAREAHQREVRSLAYSEDIKRSREIARLNQQHTDKHVHIEKLVILLILCLGVLLLLVIYLATQLARQNTPQKRAWSIPSHFTIPIFSPFTSVVEHETSVIGSKTITAITLVSAGLAYFLLRHRLPRPLAG